MLEWLKYFGLNFFSNKYAKQSKTRSLWNGILAFLIAIVVMFCAFCIMAIACFPIHYNNSTQFKQYYHGLFEGENALSIRIENGKATYTDGSETQVINTFVSDADKDVYAKNGYNVIIDLRDGNALYNDCTIGFVNKYDETHVISYEEYSELSAAKREEYSARLTMTENALEFTSESVGDFVAFIDEQGDDNVKNSLEELKVNGEIAGVNYGKVYELYYEVRYGQFGNSFSKAPTMRDYYLNTYLATDKDGKSVYDSYVILLYDVAFSSWRSDNGQVISLSGYYGDKTIEVSGENAASAADELALDLFGSNTAALKFNYFLYTVRAVFTLVFVWLLLPMFVSVIGFIAKNKTLSNYGAMCKTMGGFWLGSIIPALLFVIIASFFMSQTYVFYIGIGLLLAADIVRTVIHYLSLAAEERKNKRNDAQPDDTQKSAE